MQDYSRYQFLKVSGDKDGVLTVTLNRPEARNAVPPPMHDELEAVLFQISSDADVRSVIITGAGKGFCAGGDVKWMGERAESSVKAEVNINRARRMARAFLTLEQPVVAAVNGDAIGLGATLALFCDIIVMAQSARIGDTHVRVGLVAGDGGAVVWPLLIGFHRAKEMLMTGRLLTGPEAERLGLVNYCVPDDQLMPKASEIACNLARGSAQAIRWTKLCLNRVLAHRVDMVLDTSIALEFHTLGMEDHAEAVKAFREKRIPVFKGKASS